MQFILFVGANNTLASEEVSVQIKDAFQISPNIYRFSMESGELASSLASRLGCSIKLAVLLEGVIPNAKSISKVIIEKNFSLSTEAVTLPLTVP